MTNYNNLKGIIIGAVTGAAMFYVTPFNIIDSFFDNEKNTFFKNHSFQGYSLAQNIVIDSKIKKHEIELEKTTQALQKIKQEKENQEILIKEKIQNEISILENIKSLEQRAAEAEERANSAIGKIESLKQEQNEKNRLNEIKQNELRKKIELERELLNKRLQEEKDALEANLLNEIKTQLSTAENEQDDQLEVVNESADSEKPSAPIFKLKTDYAYFAKEHLLYVYENKLKIEKEKAQAESERLKREAVEKAKALEIANNELVKIKEEISSNIKQTPASPPAKTVSKNSKSDKKTIKNVELIYDLLISHNLDKNERHLTAPQIKNLIEGLIDISNTISNENDEVELFNKEFSYTDREKEDLILIYYTPVVSKSKPLFEKYNSLSETLSKAITTGSYRPLVIRFLPSN